MTDSERIMKVIEWSKLSKNSFATRIGFKKGQSIYNLIDGNRQITTKIATQISNAFPVINKTWLLTGEGDMFKDDNVKNIGIKNESINSNYNRQTINNVKDDGPIELAYHTKDEYIVSELERWRQVAEEMKRVNTVLIEQTSSLIKINQVNSETIAKSTETADKNADAHKVALNIANSLTDLASKKEDAIQALKEEFKEKEIAFRLKEDYWREHINKIMDIRNQNDEARGVDESKKEEQKAAS